MLDLDHLPTIGQLQATKQAAQGSDRNDCTVRALSAVTSIPYEAAFLHLHKWGRASGRRFHFQQAINKGLLTELGFTHRVIHTHPPTVLTAPRYLRHGTYLLFTRGHVAALVNGQVHDWTNGRRHRVREVFAVERQDEEIVL